MSMEVSDASNALEKLLGDVHRAERAAERRFYTPRTNILDKGGPE